MSGSKAFSIDKNDLKKIGKGAGIAAGAAAATYLLGAIPHVNFGGSTPIVVAVISILLNSALKFFRDNGASI